MNQKATEFKEWFEARMGHSASLQLAYNAIIELEQDLKKSQRPANTDKNHHVINDKPLDITPGDSFSFSSDPEHKYTAISTDKGCYNCAFSVAGYSHCQHPSRPLCSPKKRANRDAVRFIEAPNETSTQAKEQQCTK